MNFNDQKQRSNEILKSGDSLQLASLTKSLYFEQIKRPSRARVQPQRLHPAEKKAELLLFGELATALDIEMDQVQAYISENSIPDRRSAGPTARRAQFSHSGFQTAAGRFCHFAAGFPPISGCKC